MTRDLGVAAHFADRVCVLFNGKIVEDKSTVEFFKGPKNEYAKKLLSASKFQGTTKVNLPKELGSSNALENNTQSRKNLLEVSNLVKHFPIAGSSSVVQAVNDVSFSLASGETLALVGESGSGKTTIGRCLLGLEQMTAGNINFQIKH